MNKDDKFLAASLRTDRMVNRTAQMDRIRDAIYNSDQSKVILLEGHGGYGKSRLLEEVLWRGGNPRIRAKRPFEDATGRDLDWTTCGNAVVSDLIDMRNLTLHTQNNFMRAVADALSGYTSIYFARFDNNFNRLQRLTDQHSDYEAISDAIKKAKQAFLNDYASAAKHQRIVLVLDTVEDLAKASSEWLLDEGLISSEDLSLSTEYWLVDQLREGKLPNTVVLLAGRPGRDEGEPFFEHMRTLNQDNTNIDVINITVGPFTEKDTQDYFTNLKQNWEERSVNPDWSEGFEEIHKTIRNIEKDPERVKVLWLYTGGQPVRLSLYIDLIIEGEIIPEALKDSLEQTYARIKTDDPAQRPTAELEQARFEIEGQFISLIFTSIGLRSSILQVLARTQRGMSSEQLHYVLDSDSQSIENWLPDLKRLQEIEKALAKMSRLSIIKFFLNGEFSLQDEVYKIYAAHMKISGNISAERYDREFQFRKLHEWAEHQTFILQKQRQVFREKDESFLSIPSPAAVLNVGFPEISIDERGERNRLYHNIVKLQIETVYYDLLIDPERAINDSFYDLTEQFFLAYNEEALLMAQVELWRVLNNEDLMDFIDLKKYDNPSRSDDGKTILLRVAKQRDVVQWAKRFLIRGDNNRVLDFYQQVESYVENKLSGSDQKSWLHTFSQGERKCWAYYADILLAPKNLKDKLVDMENTASNLEKLARKTMKEPVFPERKEYGFIGHPAEVCLKRIIASIYNYIGYGYTTLSLYRTGVKMYGKALAYMREAEFLPQQATTRNNLARALSEMGRMRSRRICLDGLILRKKLGDDIPIAYSYNTLALIDNDQNRPDLAIAEAATALAYFRQIPDLRGIGLSLITLGEALRGLSSRRALSILIVQDPPDAIQTEAEQALNEALSIFSESRDNADDSEQNRFADFKNINEPLRECEALLELGCLHSDRLTMIDPNKSPLEWQRHYHSAINHLNKAVELAQELNLLRLELDAKVNIAWTYYRGCNHKEANESINALLADERLIPTSYRLLPNQKPPKADCDLSYVYYQLSKLLALRAHLNMKEFMERVDEIKKIVPSNREERLIRVDEDNVAQRALRQAAESFVLATGYAQLFSPRSSALTILYDSLYLYLKCFNDNELMRFHMYQQKTQEEYHTKDIEPEDKGDLDEFLLECFEVN